MAQSVFANQRPHYQKSDDPLADLAAITGYRDGARSADDFAIDLERELMSAFGGEEVSENLVEEALDVDLEAGFDEVFRAGGLVDDAGYDAEDLAYLDDPANSNEYEGETAWHETPAVAEPVAETYDAAAYAPQEEVVEAAGEAEVDLDFGDFDPADFAPAAELAVAAPAVDDFESELLAELDSSEPVQWQDDAGATFAAETAPEASFEAELGAILAEPATVTYAEPEAIAEQAPPADPFAELASLAASFKASRPSAFSRAPIWAQKRDPEPQPEVAPAGMTAPAEDFVEDAAFAVANVETAEDDYAASDDYAAYEAVDETVPLTDDLDLPENLFGDDVAPEAYSDIDVEYPEPVRASATLPAADTGGFDKVEAELTDFFAAEFARQEAEAAAKAEASVHVADVAPAYPDEHRDYAPPADLLAPRPRRGLWVAAGVAAVALLGGVSALAFMGGESVPSQPALVKADQAPVKVKPANPGGAEIANQDKAVYDKVAGSEATTKPGQPRLVTTEQEPVDVAAAAAERAPAVKGEDRVQPDAESAQPAAQAPVIQPRKVRTLVVKPDGTLVASEAAAPMAASAEPAVTYQPPAAAPVAEEPQTASLEPSDPVKDAIAAEVPAVPAEKPKAEKKSVEAKKPAEKKKPAAEKVAAAPAPAAAAATGGDWTIQIASQPSKDGAQSSYKALSGKFGSIIGGRGVSIVQAEIPGKGTFYRVRIPAGSKSDANALCARYQAAGGSCFITR